jgi:hypothetical protein
MQEFFVHCAKSLGPSRAFKQNAIDLIDYYNIDQKFMAINFPDFVGDEPQESPNRLDLL